MGTQAECCEYAPNTCAQYNSANAGSVLALGTTVAQFQAAGCYTTTGTCAAWFNGGNTCDANYHANAAALATTGATNAICCSENPKCSAYTCPAGYTATTANANNYIGAAITTTTVSTASTTACCTMTTGTCLAYASQAVNPYSCPTGYTFANAGSTVASICASTFLSTCCTAKTTCASYTCPTSMRVTSTSCAAANGVNTCADAECCATAYNTCANPATAALACSAGTKVTTTTGGNTAPCTQAEYQTACCETYPTCSTYTCPGGYTANAAVAATDAACCTDLPLCSAFTCTAGITTGKNAAATYAATNAALSAVGQDTFNTNCCVMTELCTAYWYATGTSSSAVGLRPALVTVVIGAIAGLLM